uniref:Uncharacterized protein n=1 Tax=Anguilla anguilla TaxID=7936 RepID=A0A0E9XC69_ANGAN
MSPVSVSLYLKKENGKLVQLTVFTVAFIHFHKCSNVELFSTES